MDYSKYKPSTQNLNLFGISNNKLELICSSHKHHHRDSRLYQCNYHKTQSDNFFHKKSYKLKEKKHMFL